VPSLQNAVGRIAEMSRQLAFRLSETAWLPAKDGDATGRAIFRQHYSYKPYRDGRDPALFVGPGEKMVLLTPCARALFVWRRFVSGDGQQGINCAVFRNEGAGLSSDLIREADAIADERWPGERHYTYVNPRRIRSTNPGYCFLAAGWRRCGITKWNRLRILERAAVLCLAMALSFDPHVLLLSWSADHQEVVATTSLRTCEAARDAIAAGRWLSDDPPAAMRCERGSGFAPGSDCIQGHNCGDRR
jgi:hypothetical protein